MKIDYHYTTSSTLNTPEYNTIASIPDAPAPSPTLLYVVMCFEKYGDKWINTENHLHLDSLGALRDVINYKEGRQNKKVISGRTTDNIVEAMHIEIDYINSI